MSKVASAAAAMGVGEDQLAAQLSTIISVTRQAPETVGTALRTVYARITDIQAGIDEDGVTLGKYSGDMAKIGFNVLDVNGKLRNMGEVMEEIGNKWKTLTNEQQVSLAQTMAGQRQYSNLIALFDNFDKYQSALNTAQNAGGKLQEQQDVYMDRLSTHVQQLTTATEHMWMGLVDTDGFKDVIDGLTTIVEKVDKLFQSIGGGKNLLQSLIPIVMSLTSKTVASGINTTISNAQLAKRQKQGQI
jgi:TP901 family phage tail tape measure protein